MGVEIERKFLVRADSWRNLAMTSVRIVQGYLSEDPNRVVRVRIAGHDGFLTIKGRSFGMSRLEFEYAIPEHDARQILSALCPTHIDKTRHVVEVGGRKWEIDEFEGQLKGLVVAEVELDSPTASVILPEWAGREVTEDSRYANVALVHVRPPIE